MMYCQLTREERITAFCIIRDSVNAYRGKMETLNLFLVGRGPQNVTCYFHSGNTFALKKWYDPLKRTAKDIKAFNLRNSFWWWNASTASSNFTVIWSIDSNYSIDKWNTFEVSHSAKHEIRWDVVAQTKKDAIARSWGERFAWNGQSIPKYSLSK